MNEEDEPSDLRERVKALLEKTAPARERLLRERKTMSGEYLLNFEVVTMEPDETSNIVVWGSAECTVKRLIMPKTQEHLELIHITADDKPIEVLWIKHLENDQGVGRIERELNPTLLRAGRKLEVRLKNNSKEKSEVRMTAVLGIDEGGAY